VHALRIFHSPLRHYSYLLFSKYIAISAHFSLGDKPSFELFSLLRHYMYALCARYLMHGWFILRSFIHFIIHCRQDASIVSVPRFNACVRSKLITPQGCHYYEILLSYSWSTRTLMPQLASGLLWGSFESEEMRMSSLSLRCNRPFSHSTNRALSVLCWSPPPKNTFYIPPFAEFYIRFVDFDFYQWTVNSMHDDDHVVHDVTAPREQKIASREVGFFGFLINRPMRTSCV